MSLSVDIRKKLGGFSLNVKFDTEKDRLGLLGASGCGKSMTLKCIAGIERPDEGIITLNGRVLFDSYQRIDVIPQKRKVGYLFQNYALFPNMTVTENIGCGLKGSMTEKMPRIRQMVEMLHLQSLEKHYPMQLSGGQQQRVALARILAYEPDVLMLDEPFSALDTYLKENLQQELLETLKEYEGDTLIVSHSRDELYSMCEKLAIIDNGSLILTGKTQEIFKNPGKVIAARLTGCKNFSKVKKISDYEVDAIDWGIHVKTKEIVSESVKYAGIRAHDIRSALNCSEENSFPCNLLRIAQTPFELNIICQGKNSELWWKVSKAYWSTSLKEEVPEYICLPKEAIMLLD